MEDLKIYKAKNLSSLSLDFYINPVCAGFPSPAEDHLDVALDLRKGSKTFGKHFKVILTADNNKSVFLPAGFAHGFLALKKENIVNYNITNYRSAKHEVSLVWNDKDLKIKWPIKNPILSKKDKMALTFYEYKKLHMKNS